MEIVLWHVIFFSFFYNAKNQLHFFSMLEACAYRTLRPSQLRLYTTLPLFVSYRAVTSGVLVSLQYAV